jgi:hypothetical protein
MVESHLEHRTSPSVVVSDERPLLLETGGGLVKAQHRRTVRATFVARAISTWPVTES